jgi:glc operon protein GlcG
MLRLIGSLSALAALLLSAPAHAQVAEKKTLTLAGAERVVAAAVSEARRLKTTGAVAVVDDGGNLLALSRIDGTFAAAGRISTGKARTAALFKKPTRAFEEIIGKGRTAMIALEDFTPLQGGIPLTVDGQIVGAVGVSGAATAQQDEELAVVAAAALATPASPRAEAPVTVVPREKVAAAFQRGSPLLEVGDYKVHASHRTGPGQVEIHTYDTDIIHVLKGQATLVTGGTVVSPQTIAPEEIRAASVQGGEARRIAEGDVVVVPNGVPHWFREVPGPLDYYVVKVRAQTGSMP